MIGKGGYGKVFSVQHKLDGVRYAVKKVALSISSMRMTGREGYSKLDCLLQELRTLAKMDHPNIVRYFGGWLEYSISDQMSSAAIPQPTGSEKLIEKDSSTDSLLNTVSSSTCDIADGQPGLPNVGSHMLPEDIIFENSSTKSTRISESNEKHPAKRHTTCKCSKCCVINHADTISREGHSSSGGLLLGRAKDIEYTRAPAVFLTENVASSYSPTKHSESGSPFYSGSKANVSSYATDPSLTLYIQMSLHPFSLADFIDHTSPLPSKSNSDVQTYSHCFHASISLQILLILMDGIQYLHRQGVVHRDLKPANVFLDVSSTAGQQARSIDLSACPDCQTASSDADDELDSMPAFLNIRIGDFGLAAAISRSRDVDGHEENIPTGTMTDPDSTTMSDTHSSVLIFEAEDSQPVREEAVGTHFYKPPTPTSRSRCSKLPDLHTNLERKGKRIYELTEKLDVYAIGIILLELLCPFKTREP